MEARTAAEIAKVSGAAKLTGELVCEAARLY
jgi:hypothetical protein